MALRSGARLGPYEVTGSLGAGGMGEVYSATDTRLDRTVAIKVLPAELASDPERRERFEREAKAIAALNHPHICTLHEFDSHEGTDFLVMEHLEGESLQDRLTKGALPLDHALQIAIQIADALDKAHRQGITHRDLKPGNIFLTTSGAARQGSPQAKLLDFGLAKLTEQTPTGEDSTKLADSLTAQGTILGTFHYMSPEQLEGKEVDARSDIWAFGCVVYEMVTGQKAFEGESQASLIVAIMEGEPVPVSSLKPVSPAALDYVITTCLEKDSDDRWQTVRDLARELRRVKATPPALGDSAPASVSGLAWKWVVPCMAVAVLLGGFGWAALTSTSPSPLSSRLARFELSLPREAPLYVAITQPDVAISPDGSRVIARGGSGTAAGTLFIRELDNLTPTALVQGRPWGPFVSPDGAWVGFEDQSGTLNKVPMSGGASTEICELEGRLQGASWGDDDTIVFATNDRGILWRVPAAGGAPEPLLTPDPADGRAYQWPDVLPGSRAVLFAIEATSETGTGQVAALDLDTQEVHVLFAGTFPRFVATGHVVFNAGGGEIRAVGFDTDRLMATTEPVTVIDDVLTKPSGSADFAVAANGTLVYVPAEGGIRSSRSQVVPVVVSRGGIQEQLPGLSGDLYQSLDVSPDGERIAFEVRDPTTDFTADIWVYDVGRALLDRLTTDPIDEISPVWSVDNEHLAFAANSEAGWGLFRTTDGTNVEQLAMMDDALLLTPQSWVSEGSILVGVRSPGRTMASIARWSGEQALTSLFDRDIHRVHPTVSPDGRWIAYSSYRSGRMEVYVSRFPELVERHLVSNQGGDWPSWSADGRELYYVTDESTLTATLMAVPITSGAIFESGASTPLFEGQFRLAYARRSYDVTPDGRFVMLTLQGDRGDSELVLVQGWDEELLSRVPLD